MRIFFTLSFVILLITGKTQNPLPNLGSSEKNHFVDLDGSMSPTLFAQMTGLIRTWTTVTLTNVNSEQLQTVVDKLNSLGQVKSLEINGITFPENSLQNIRFSTATLTLTDCSLSDKNSSVKLPATTALIVENTSAPLVLAILKSNRNIKSIEVSNCDLSAEKELFSLIEQSPVQSLSLTYCALERLPFDLGKMKKLNSLDISSNNISLIDTTGISRLDNFTCEDNPVTDLIRQPAVSKEKTMQAFGWASPNDSLFLSKHPFLKPASKTYNVKPQEFRINGSAQIKTNDGAIFKIPQNCFVDSKGNTVTGPVKVVVREYNSPQSIILAGIPMFLDTAGKKDYLVSDGMFEIEAYSNNEKLQLKPGEKIRVDYPSANGLTNGNQLYDLNPLTGSWDNISTNGGFNGKAIPRKDSIILNKPSKAVEKYLLMLNDFQMVEDTTTFDQRFYDKWHCGEQLIDSCLINKHMNFDEVYALNKSAETFLVQKRNVIVNRETQPLVKLITRERKNRRIYGSVSSIWWKIQDPLTEEALEHLGTTYCDVRFELGHDSTITLLLKDHTGIHPYHVEAFSYYRSIAVKNRAHRIVTTIVDRQQKRNATKAKPSHQIHTPYAGLSDRKCWRKIKRLRNQQERQMSFNEFHCYALPRLMYGAYADLTSVKVAYQFSLTGLGLKNIDCRHSLKAPVDFMAKTFDNDSIIQSYVYQPGANLLINFNGFKGKTNKVMAESNRDTYLVNVCNGEVSYGYFSAQDIKAMDANETMCTPVKMPVSEFSIEKMGQDLERLSPKVYPNPGTGIFNLEMPGLERFDVSVYSLNGQFIRTITDHGNHSTLNLSDLNNGTYLLIIKSNGKNLSSVKVTIHQ